MSFVFKKKDVIVNHQSSRDYKSDKNWRGKIKLLLLAKIYSSAQNIQEDLSANYLKLKKNQFFSTFVPEALASLVKQEKGGEITRI